MAETVKRLNRRRFFQGVVISDKMDKTRVVQINRSTKHDKYHKVIKISTKFKAHDEKNQTRTGDIVKIMETRPLSKDKRWIIVEVVKSNQEAAL